MLIHLFFTIDFLEAVAFYLTNIAEKSFKKFNFDLKLSKLFNVEQFPKLNWTS